MSLCLNGSVSQSLPGVQDTAVPAVGADSVSHRRSVRQHTSPPRIRAASHRLRRLAPRISVSASCLYSKASASSRGPSSPASTSVRAHSFGPSRPRPRRPSAQTFSCRSLSAARSLRSPVRGPAKARQPTRTRPPPGPSLRCAPAPWSLADSLTAPTTPRTLLPSMRLPTTKALKLTYASASVLPRTLYPARRGEKGFINMQQEAAARPLPSFL